MFKAQEFKIGELKGISAKNIEEHLKLYEGYVKQSNLVLEKIAELSDPLAGGAEENMGLLSGLQRRLSFEFNGMRNHEYYFSSLEEGSKELGDESELKKEIEKTWGSFEKFLNYFKSMATTRGVGWAMLYWDKKTERLLAQWVDEQHLGHLNGCQTILALDMWEHSYVADYQPSGKKQYIEDFFSNLNWSVIENNFDKVKE